MLCVLHSVMPVSPSQKVRLKYHKEYLRHSNSIPSRWPRETLGFFFSMFKVSRNTHTFQMNKLKAGKTMSQLAMHYKSSTSWLPQSRPPRAVSVQLPVTVPQMQCLPSSALSVPQLASLRLETDPLQWLGWSKDMDRSAGFNGQAGRKSLLAL